MFDIETLLIFLSLIIFSELSVAFYKGFFPISKEDCAFNALKTAHEKDLNEYVQIAKLRTKMIEFRITTALI